MDVLSCSPDAGETTNLAIHVEHGTQKKRFTAAVQVTGPVALAVDDAHSFILDQRAPLEHVEGALKIGLFRSGWLLDSKLTRKLLPYSARKANAVVTKDMSFLCLPESWHEQFAGLRPDGPQPAGSMMVFARSSLIKELVRPCAVVTPPPIHP
jgi:hypothetical protein